MSDAMAYTDSAKVSEVKKTALPNKGQTVGGYGSRVPSFAMIKYDGYWHRVLVMIYSNAGTAYIVKNGKRLIIDTDTEFRIQDAS